MVYRQRRLHRVAPQVGQRIDDLRNAFGGHAHRLAAVVDAEHQRAAVGVVGKRHQVFGQALFKLVTVSSVRTCQGQITGACSGMRDGIKAKTFREELMVRHCAFQSSSFNSCGTGLRLSSRHRKAVITQCFVAM